MGDFCVIHHEFERYSRRKRIDVPFILFFCDDNDSKSRDIISLGNQLCSQYNLVLCICVKWDDYSFKNGNLPKQEKYYAYHHQSIGQTVCIKDVTTNNLKPIFIDIEEKMGKKRNYRLALGKIRTHERIGRSVSQNRVVEGQNIELDQQENLNSNPIDLNLPHYPPLNVQERSSDSGRRTSTQTSTSHSNLQYIPMKSTQEIFPELNTPQQVVARESSIQRYHSCVTTHCQPTSTQHPHQIPRQQQEFLNQTTYKQLPTSQHMVPTYPLGQTIGHLQGSTSSSTVTRPLSSQQQLRRRPEATVSQPPSNISPKQYIVISSSSSESSISPGPKQDNLEEFNEDVYGTHISQRRTMPEKRLEGSPFDTPNSKTPPVVGITSHITPQPQSSRKRTLSPPRFPQKTMTQTHSPAYTGNEYGGFQQQHYSINSPFYQPQGQYPGPFYGFNFYPGLQYSTYMPRYFIPTPVQSTYVQPQTHQSHTENSSSRTERSSESRESRSHISRHSSPAKSPSPETLNIPSATRQVERATPSSYPRPAMPRSRSVSPANSSTALVVSTSTTLAGSRTTIKDKTQENVLDPERKAWTAFQASQQAQNLPSQPQPRNIQPQTTRTIRMPRTPSVTHTTPNQPRHVRSNRVRRRSTSDQQHRPTH